MNQFEAEALLCAANLGLHNRYIETEDVSLGTRDYHDHEAKHPAIVY